MAQGDVQITAKLGRKLTAEEEQKKESLEKGRSVRIEMEAVQGQWGDDDFYLICPYCGCGAMYDVPPDFHICPCCGNEFFWGP